VSLLSSRGMALWRSKARAAATVAGSPRRRLELTGKETREQDAELGNRADVFGTGPQCAASIARFRHEDDRHRRRETVEKLGIKGTVTVE